MSRARKLDFRRTDSGLSREGKIVWGTRGQFWDATAGVLPIVLTSKMFCSLAARLPRMKALIFSVIFLGLCSIGHTQSTPNPTPEQRSPEQEAVHKAVDE